MKGIGIHAVLLGAGLAICGPLARAQANDAAPAAAVVPAIPEDQQATTEQLARLFDVMRVKQQLATSMRTIPAMAQQQMQQQLQQMQKDNPQMGSLTEEQQQAMKSVMGKFMAKAMTLYGSDEMIADMTSLYQKHLSRADAETTIAFYSTATGQHLLDMLPVIMQEFMPTVMQKTQGRMTPLILEMTKEMAEITAHGAERPSQK